MVVRVDSSQDNHGQTSIELIISLAFLILTFVILVLLATDKTEESAELKIYLDVKRIGESIKDNVNTVSQQGPGYYKYFSLPERIRGHFDYNVSVEGNTLYISWDHRLSPWSSQMVTPNVTVINITKGLNSRNCVINDEGVVKIKRICGKVAVLVYEGEGRDRTLLDGLSGSCKIEVENTSDAGYLTPERLAEYDVLWMEYNSVAGGSYTLDADSEAAIKDFAYNGGIVWSDSQEYTTWRADWLPYYVDVGSGGDVNMNTTEDAGTFFDIPSQVDPDNLVFDEYYTGWTSGYKVMAYQEGNETRAGFLRLDYGSGTYLLSTLNVDAAMTEYDGNNTAIFNNMFNQLTPRSKC
ncbi:MAG: hypothetical protein ABIH11_00090 [Candidatus Altiarchaeota archaeon]